MESEINDITKRIRDELAAMNVVIKDSKEGTTWEIKG